MIWINSSNDVAMQPVLKQLQQGHQRLLDPAYCSWLRAAGTWRLLLENWDDDAKHQPRRLAVKLPPNEVIPAMK